MPKKRPLHLTLLVIGALFLIYAVYSLVLYFSNIRYYEPIKINLNKASLDIEKTQIYSITPNNAREYFIKNKVNSSFSVYYGFRKNIYLEIPDTLYNTFFAEIIIGNKVFKLTSRELTKIYSGIYVLNVYSEIKIPPLIYSVIYWDVVQKIIKLICTLCILFILVFYRRNFKRLFKFILSIVGSLIKLTSDMVFKAYFFFRLMLKKTRKAALNGFSIIKNLSVRIKSILYHYFKRVVKFYQKVSLKLFSILSHYRGKIINRHVISFIDKRLYRIIICLLIFLISCLLLSEKMNFSDTASFNWDVRDYQTIAVNFAKGHGIHKSGIIEPFSTYKFDTVSTSRETWYPTAKRLTMMFPGKFAFFRNPGYPFFLGIVYKIFGIHPAIAKYIQFIMLLLVFSFLPVLLYRIWGTSGFLCAVIAFPLMINKDLIWMSSNMMTEWLQIILLFLLIFAVIYHQKKMNLISSLILGVLFGLSFLIKVSLIFIPIIYFLYQIYILYKRKKNAFIKTNIIALFLYLAIISTWTLYGSIQIKELKANWKVIIAILSEKQSNKIEKADKISTFYPLLAQSMRNDSVIDLSVLKNKKLYYKTLSSCSENGDLIIKNPLSSQQLFCFYNDYIALQPDVFMFVSYPKNSLLLIQNEFVRLNTEYNKELVKFQTSNSNGVFSFEWSKDNNSFYKNDNSEGKSPFIRVINFYIHNPKQFVINSFILFFTGFSEMPFFWGLMILFIFEFIVLLYKKFGFNKFIFGFFIIISCISLFIPHILLANYASLLLVILFSTVLILRNLLFKEDAYAIQLPVIFKIIVLNFILINFLSGVPRYMIPVGFIIKLVFIYYLYKLSLKLKVIKSAKA